MTRKEQIQQVALELYPFIYSSSKERYAYVQGAEWADQNPSEKNIASYLGRKGWPLSTYGIPTYEEAFETINKYYKYKKEQWINTACKWLKELVGKDELFINDFRKIIEEI